MGNFHQIACEQCDVGRNPKESPGQGGAGWPPWPRLRRRSRLAPDDAQRAGFVEDDGELGGELLRCAAGGTRDWPFHSFAHPKELAKITKTFLV